MNKHILVQSTCTLLLSVLCATASAAADNSVPPDRFLFGSKPTDYQWFSHSQPDAQPTMRQGVQGPIRTETMDEQPNAQPAYPTPDNMSQPSREPMTNPSPMQEQPSQYPSY
ncbi:MAG: hypothetical protein ACM3X0_11240 [Bacteroidota bacterium]